MSSEDGGPAFPSSVEMPIKVWNGEEYEERPDKGFYPPDHHAGMTLRDYFAGQALTGFLSSVLANEDIRDPEAFSLVSVASYRFADAMLKARTESEAPREQ